MILQIARMGHPILSKRAEEVKDAAHPRIQQLIADMIETFIETGVGLAAPQVFESVRIMMMHMPEELALKRGMKEGVPLTILINPVIEPLSDELESNWEACLSIPDMMGEVPRFRAVRYSGITETGERIVREVEGYHARMVQHEYDHLEGILYPERMTNFKRFGFRKEVRASLETR